MSEIIDEDQAFADLIAQSSTGAASKGLL